MPNDHLSADDVAELGHFIPALMGPALSELRAIAATVTIDLLLLHAQRQLKEQLIEPARKRDTIETARRRR